MTDSQNEVLVWGAGAIGSVIGAHLVRAGRRVVFVDIDEEHLARINGDALHISGPVADFTIGARAVRPDQLTGTFNEVLLAVRLYDTARAVEALARHITAESMVISCQNGFGADAVAAALGPKRTIAASFFLPAEFRGNGEVVYGARADMALGLVEGGDPDVLASAVSLLQQFEPSVHVDPDIRSVIWTKMSYGALLAAAALDGGLTANFLSSPARWPIVVGLMRELSAVARFDGHRLRETEWFRPAALTSASEADIRDAIAPTLAVLARSAKQHSGYWHQVVVRRRPTELSVQYAPVIERAAAAQLQIPVLERLLHLIAIFERQGGKVDGDPIVDLQNHAIASGHGLS